MPEPEYRQPKKQVYKPGTRNIEKTTAKSTGELPWWAKTKPGEMTAAAEHELPRMKASKEAKRLNGAFFRD